MSDGCDLLELLSSSAVEQRVPADTRCAVLQFPDPVPDPACTGLNTRAGILPTESSELDRFDRGVLHGHLRCRLPCEVPGPVGDRSGSARCQRCNTAAGASRPSFITSRTSRSTGPSRRRASPGAAGGSAYVGVRSVQEGCVLSEDPDVLPLAIRLVTSDPDKHVRAMAG